MNNGLKDIAQLVALIVADLKADNDKAEFYTEEQVPGVWIATDENYDGPGSPIGSGTSKQAAIADLKDQLEAREEELKLQQFREELGKLDPRAPVWGKVDERIDREWDRGED